MSKLALVTTLPVFDFKDPVGTIRGLADKIEAGDFGPVGAVAMVIMGDETFVAGAGIDSSAPSIALLLHAGFMQMSMSVANHGKE